MGTTTRETDTSGPARAEQDEPASMSRGRRLGITALILLTLVGMLASTAPRGVIKDGLLDLTRPYLLATGLDQAWGVFAPSPPRVTNEVVARVERADGTVGVYPLHGGNGLTEYWDYRWRKYGEQMWKKRSAERERAAFAGWVADRDRAAGHRPVRVTLVRAVRPNAPPGGPAPDAGSGREIPFFTTPVAQR
ncbi:hypothetical protein [Actinomycetospora cinnamomea]|uniref:Uncharacterized protein n=1 Tax=Actinomycetospora cinnamomea TaxID=663609 RepID=A0A2U1FM56_9PSEU|nr:hypothetical protein [Actinomycetospora cinnamomea]PVZ13273.1 hypothetical protein C8D89_102423 [Actinomycetospora cinnamomea]